MKLLFLGDVVGRSGRDAVCEALPRLKAAHALDFIVVNGENSAAGFGMTPGIAADFFAAGADVLTCGDHVWDQQELTPALAQNPKLLRPHNYPSTAPGSGAYLATNAQGKKILVLHLMGQVFMRDNVDCPFKTADAALSAYRLGQNVDAILVDVHAEATSEKMALGKYLDGRVSAVIGSHTHIPTNDAHVMKGGTAYQTDAGMCGDYDSVIGMESSAPLQRFLTKIQKVRMTAASGPATICGAIIEVNDKTGLASAITPLKIGGVLG